MHAAEKMRARGGAVIDKSKQCAVSPSIPHPAPSFSSYLNTNSNCNSITQMFKQTHTAAARSCSVVVVDHTGCIIVQLECRDESRRAVKRRVERWRETGSEG